ncbi:MAG TPA: hypothetical protein VLA91_05155 [Acidimicrobiia bacterium]|nr:hypothetical protein [Acidimicrobiia bacterium]
MTRPTQPDRELFDRLAAASGEALISIYLPTPVRGAEIDQSRILLKNGIAQVDRWLEDVGWKPRVREERLEVAHALLDDQEFWEHQRPGLAVLIDDEGEPTPVALTGPVEKRAVLAASFHLRPTIPSIEPTRLPVLVLTRHGVRLYSASSHDAYPVDADLPKSVDDVNWFVDREKQRQQHADRAGSKRSRHGHDPSASEGEDLDRFLRAVSAGLPEADPLRPLVVLGDDNLVAHFENVHDHEMISPPNSGIGDVDDVREVQEKAAEVVEDHEAVEHGTHLGLAREQLGTGNAITELTEGLIAAVSGRVSRLLIHREASPIWGRFDPSNLDVTFHDEQEVFDVDLLDRLAVHAMLTGAPVATTETPVDGHVFVAITRF